MVLSATYVNYDSYSILIWHLFYANVNMTAKGNVDGANVKKEDIYLSNATRELWE